MAKVSKIRKKRRDGTQLERWSLTYEDAEHVRHRRNFKTKAAADAERVRIEGQLAGGLHVPDRNSLTVLQACRGWLAHIESLVKIGKREAATLRPYGNHVDLYIAPHDIAQVKLSRLTTPACQAFVDHLDATVSHAMAVKVLRSLRMALGHAVRKGWVTANPATPTRLERRDRHREPVEIPTKAELRAMLVAAQLLDDAGITSYAEPLITLGLFSGLRISEMRGLGRPQLAIAGDGARQRHAVTVNQRADERNRLGAPKTAASRRTVPLGPQTVAALRRWLERMPEPMRKSEKHLVFPTGSGKVEGYANLYHRVWTPVLIIAGIVADPEVPTGRQAPRYGIHALRHAAASIWIEQGLTPKQVQSRMGHATLQMTMDLYGHLWPDPSGDARTARASERVILG